MSSLISPRSFFYSYPDHRDLHSFPTRRSSDLTEVGAVTGGVQQHVAAVGQVVADELADDGRSDEVVGALQHQRRCLHPDRKSTRLNSSHVRISYAVFCLKKKKIESGTIIK